MRILPIIRMFGLVVSLVLWGACGQEAPPSKPPETVVKRITDQRTPPPGPERPGGRQGTESGARPEAEKIEEDVAPGTGVPEEEEALLAQKIDYVYDPGDRPDPFIPFFKPDQEKEGAWECEGVPPGPLTDKEVAQFTLVAVVKRGGQNVAMVQDPEGKGYTIRVGTHLGLRCGKVTAVSPEGVIVEEPYRDVLGNKKIRRVPLRLRTSE